MVGAAAWKNLAPINAKRPTCAVVYCDKDRRECDSGDVSKTLGIVTVLCLLFLKLLILFVLLMFAIGTVCVIE